MLAGGEQIAFGIKDFEVIGHAFAVAQARQSRDAFLCGDALFLRGDLLSQPAASGKPVRHFAECGLDRLFIQRDLFGFARPGEIEVGFARAPVEDRQ